MRRKLQREFSNCFLCIDLGAVSTSLLQKIFHLFFRWVLTRSFDVKVPDTVWKIFNYEHHEHSSDNNEAIIYLCQCQGWSPEAFERQKETWLRFVVKESNKNSLGPPVSNDANLSITIGLWHTRAQTVARQSHIVCPFLVYRKTNNQHRSAISPDFDTLSCSSFVFQVPCARRYSNPLLNQRVSWFVW